MRSSATLDALRQRLIDVTQLNNKLILLVGSSTQDRAALLRGLRDSGTPEPLHLGVALAGPLAELPHRERNLQAGSLLRAAAKEHAATGPLLIEGVELLFDSSLRLNALDLLRRQAQARPVVAAWPGEWRDRRLTYAVPGHPEYQDQGADGATIFEIHQGE